MFLFALVVSHHTARVGQRERVSLSGGRACGLLQALGDDRRVTESVALSTCNRTEVYAVAASRLDGEAAVSQALADATGVGEAELAALSFMLWGPDAAAHLIRVAASLDSMVIGETEIQGQVRAALRLAEAHGTAGHQLRELFRRALVVGKRVRRKTEIGRGAVSFSSVAVEVARKTFSDLASCSAVLAGAGRMAQATALALMGSGVRIVCVANRSLAAAEELAERVAARGVSLAALPDELADADIAICSTDSPGPILLAADLRRAVQDRRDRPLLVIDMAVPRDVEPSVRRLPGVILRDIDDLERVVQANVNGRLQEAERAERIVQQELRRAYGGIARPAALRALPTGSRRRAAISS